MSKNKKTVAVIIAVIVLIGVGVGLWFIYQSSKETPTEGEKLITVKVVSERDSYTFEQDYKTDEEYLGDFLEKEDLIQFDTTEFGRFIKGVKGYMSDDAEQSWWQVLVDGERALTGVDEIVVDDGKTYTLQLVIGW